MLFKKNNAPVLSDELFRNPTAEYRGAPFWSWNCKLDEKELHRQIGELKEMGFGGYHIHCRSGMATEYLGEEFMSLVKSCVRKGKKENMFTWLYDEDRWPSGFAGGIVTKEKRYRGRSLIFSPNPYAPPESKVCGEIQEKPHLDLGRFDIVFSDDGRLKSYRRLMDGEEAEGEVFYAYVVLRADSPRYNNQTYVDTLNRDAIKRFIEVTHEAYKKAVGREFDKSIPAIFTDEPAFRVKKRLEFAADRKEVALPFTDDLEMTYEAKYGASLVEHLPELLWDLEGGAPSVTRYRYHAHVAERFAEAFADQIGAWCDRNGLALTGHLRGEGRLGMQISHVGEAMLSYRGFQIPGIDVLWGDYDFNTAKQCQSAVRQYGREAMMSELYGVTTWDFDFRGYKLAGDRWLFICKGCFPIDKDQSIHSPVTVRLRGLYSAQLYDTLSGEIRDLAVTYRNGKTEIVVEAELDGEKSEIIAYAPYKVSLGRVTAGNHRVTVRLYVPRTNGFGPVHLASECYSREGCPDAWRTAGDLFAYEYHLKCKGVLMKPQLTLVK